jgi:hypothetical protein
MTESEFDWFNCVADAIAEKCGTRPDPQDLYDAENGPPSDDADALNRLIYLSVLSALESGEPL